MQGHPLINLNVTLHMSYLNFKPLVDQKPHITGTLANNEDPDEMQKNAAFHLGLHCLLRQNTS